MDTQTTLPQQRIPDQRQEPLSSPPVFVSGSTVIYALHGRCTVLGIEVRTIEGQALEFYRLEVQKSALSRSTRQEPAIWLPVNSARDRGLRLPMSRTEAEAAMAIIQGREYYFSVTQPWSVLQAQLEACIRQEGAQGLAKAVSFLHVYRKYQVVFPPEVNRFAESVHKVFLRELVDAFSESLKVLEQRIQKGLRHKLIPDV